MGATGFTLPPGRRFKLAEIDPDDTGDYRTKGEARDDLEKHLVRLRALQEMLYADGRRALLLVLQGMDTGGKDGTIKHVVGACNPQGIRLTSFKVPTAEELAHDFLWRVHRATPGRGSFGIFNRSHYEDVLVVRVRRLAPKAEWKRRFDHINAFERVLVDSGVTIVKVFLWISRAEQAERLRARQNDPTKQWKFNPGDLEDRALWGDYVTAYEDALTRCNTSYAQWHVVPANRKWYRNLVVSNLLVEALDGLHLRFPKPAPGITDLVIPE